MVIILELILGAIMGLANLLMQLLFSIVEGSLGIVDGDGTMLGTFFSTFPAIKVVGSMFKVIGSFIVLTLLLKNLFQRLLGQFSETSESIIVVLGRSLMAYFLIGYSVTIANIMFKPATVIYNAFNSVSSGSLTQTGNTMVDALTKIGKGGALITFGSSLNGFVAADALLTVIFFAMSTLLVIMLAKNYFILVLEFLERYVITGINALVLPLGFATLADKNWAHIGHSIVRSLVSSLLLLSFNVLFIRVFHDSFGLMVSASNPLLTLMFLVALIKIGQRWDEYVSAWGLTTVQTGKNLGRDLFMTTETTAFKGLQSAGGKLAAGAIGAVTGSKVNPEGRSAVNVGGTQAVNTVRDAFTGGRRGKIEGSVVGGGKSGHLNKTHEENKLMKRSPSRLNAKDFEEMKNRAKNNKETFASKDVGDAINAVLGNRFDDEEIVNGVIKDGEMSLTTQDENGEITTHHFSEPSQRNAMSGDAKYIEDENGNKYVHSYEGPEGLATFANEKGLPSSSEDKEDIERLVLGSGAQSDVSALDLDVGEVGIGDTLALETDDELIAFTANENTISDDGHLITRNESGEIDPEGSYIQDAAGNLYNLNDYEGLGASEAGVQDSFIAADGTRHELFQEGVYETKQDGNQKFVAAKGSDGEKTWVEIDPETVGQTTSSYLNLSSFDEDGVTTTYNPIMGEVEDPSSAFVLGDDGNYYTGVEEVSSEDNAYLGQTYTMTGFDENGNEATFTKTTTRSDDGIQYYEQSYSVGGIETDELGRIKLSDIESYSAHGGQVDFTLSDGTEVSAYALDLNNIDYSNANPDYLGKTTFGSPGNQREFVFENQSPGNFLEGMIDRGKSSVHYEGYSDTLSPMIKANTNADLVLGSVEDITINRDKGFIEFTNYSTDGVTGASQTTTWQIYNAQTHDVKNGDFIKGTFKGQEAFFVKVAESVPGNKSKSGNTEYQDLNYSVSPKQSFSNRLKARVRGGISLGRKTSTAESKLQSKRRRRNRK